MLEANEKQVPLKSYSLKIRIDSVNQILKNKEKVTQTRNINILTRITDRKIPFVYIHVFQIVKNRGPGPYNLQRHAGNRKYFSGLSLMEVEGKRTCFTWRRKWEKFGDVPAEEKVTLSRLMNSNMVKREKRHYLHLFYHFTVPLILCNIVNNDYHQDSRVIYTFAPNKLFGQLLDISPKFL